MRQQGQVFELQTRSADGRRLWAYRYRAGGAARGGVIRAGRMAESEKDGDGETTRMEAPSEDAAILSSRPNIGSTSWRGERL
jgi:hypothetical protein